MISLARRLTRMSIFSIGSDLFDENMNESMTNNHSSNRRWFRTPFLYKISKFNAPEWRWILLGTIVSIAFGCSGPLYGLIFANLYDAFGETDIATQERITRNYAIIAFFIGLGSGVSQLLTSLSFAKSGEALTMRMRKLIFSAILRQEMSYFDQESNSTGALVTRLSTDAAALKVRAFVRWEKKRTRSSSSIGINWRSCGNYSPIDQYGHIRSYTRIHCQLEDYTRYFEFFAVDDFIG